MPKVLIIRRRGRQLTGLRAVRPRGVAIIILTDNKAVRLQFFQMGDDRAFGHRVRFRGNIRINLRDNILWRARPGPHRCQNTTFTLKPVRNVLCDFRSRITDRRAMRAK